jgi:Transposase
MEAFQPQVVHIPIHCAFKKAPCPHCGMKGRRKKVLHRQVRTIQYKKVAYLDIAYGEYEAKCSCCRYFRNTPPEVKPKADYDDRVRQAVLDRILDDAMSIEGVLKAMRRDFLLDLSTGFVYDCLHQAVEQLDMAEHRRKVLERFSGTLCVDELHLGRYTLLLATDPLQDLPVAFALVASNDQAHMERFLKNLKTGGLLPRVVVTDGSNLYPTVLARVWPQAAHQLCVFHVLKDINDKILDEVRRLRNAFARRGRKGRRRRGRPGPGQQARRRRRGPSPKEKAKFIFKRRFLIVKRREHLSKREGQDLRQMLEYLPALQTLRSFADDIYQLLAPKQSPHRAWCLRARLLQRPTYQEFPGLVAAMGMLEAKKFAKMIAFLKCPVRRRVRTNNHVERANRKLRYFEKVRYKWRRRRTLVRFLVLALDHWWKEAWKKDQEPEGRSKAEPTTNPRPSKGKPGGRPKKVAA